MSIVFRIFALVKDRLIMSLIFSEKEKNKIAKE